MKCPLDQTTLTIAERQGIEIDYCPQCRGVWLDRGELDKLIDRSAQEYGEYDPQQGQRAAAPRYAEEPRYERRPQYRPYDHDDDDDHRRGGHRKRRRGFLGDVFDFD